MFKTNLETIRGFLLNPVHLYNNPLVPNLSGFYRAKNGDIIALSPFFCIHLTNIDVPDFPLNSYFNIFADKIMENYYPYPAEPETFLKVFDTDKILSVSKFNVLNTLGKLERLSEQEKAKTRVIFSATDFSNGFPMIFSGRDADGTPVAYTKNGTVKWTATDDGIIKTRDIVPGLPYKIVPSKRGENTVDVIALQGIFRMSFLTTQRYWTQEEETILGTAVPQELKENTNAFKQYAKAPVLPLHLDCNLFAGLFKLFILAGYEQFNVVLPSPEVKELRVFDLRKGGPEGDMHIVTADDNSRFLETHTPENGIISEELLLGFMTSTPRNEDDLGIEIAVAGRDYANAGFQNS